MRSLQILILAFGILIAPYGVAAKEVVSVNGRKISEEQLKSALSGFNESQKERILEEKTSRDQLIDSLVSQELLVQEAEKESLQSTQEYKQALDTFRRQFLASLLVKKKLNSKLNEKAVKRYWQRNRFRYSTEQVRVHHILLDTRKEAKKILDLAKKKDADFQKLAEKYSKDSSAVNNRGDIGYITRDRMDPEFTGVAFRTKVGKVSGPVKTAFGFHIIKVVDRVSGDVLSYNDVQLKVKAALRNELVNRYVTELRADAKILTVKDK